MEGETEIHVRTFHGNASGTKEMKEEKLRMIRVLL